MHDEELADLAKGAEAVLRANDRGDDEGHRWTQPSADLYPHQWSWDSGFCAIGWATIDPIRAVDELRTLFRAQWANGMVPHIVFDPAVADDAYLPGPDRWAAHATGAPTGVLTSGLCQPPVHAIALRRVWHRSQLPDVDPAVTTAVRHRLAELWPKVAAWHRYLHRARDAEGSGLVTIWHPWESGLDNSPRWDRALTRVEPGPLAPYRRPDLAGVPADERPDNDAYDRYLWLVELARRDGYDDAALADHHPFRVKDVLFSAILAAADSALAGLAADLDIGVSADEVADLQLAADRTRAALDRCWDHDAGLCLDLDLVSGEPIHARTVAGFAPLIAGGLLDRAQELTATLDSASFGGAPDLRWRLPPSTAIDDPAFDPRNYWRGPTWPVTTWLLWWSLRRADRHERAAMLRAEALAQLAATGPCEYVDPFRGEALGSPDQSWTAAVVLDWLSS